MMHEPEAENAQQQSGEVMHEPKAENAQQQSGEARDVPYIRRHSFNFGVTKVSAEPEQEIWPRVDHPKNAAYVSPAFQELNNRVPEIKAKKKQQNT